MLDDSVLLGLEERTLDALSLLLSFERELWCLSVKLISSLVALEEEVLLGQAVLSELVDLRLLEHEARTGVLARAVDVAVRAAGASAARHWIAARRILSKPVLCRLRLPKLALVQCLSSL